MSCVCASKISIKYGLAKFQLIDMALKGVKDPINLFIKKYSKNLYFSEIVRDIKKIKKLKSKPHNYAVKKLGITCRYPGTFNSSIHAIVKSRTYKKAILTTIKAGGCNCSRSNFLGAYFSALNGSSDIPLSWISKCLHSKNILNLG